MNWIQRLINGDRSPVPPRLPNNLADLPVLTAQHLDGAAVAPAPAEMPSDELMQQWSTIALHEWLLNGPPAPHGIALLAIAWARQQHAQSFKLPPPGADPVATTENLWDLFTSVLSADSGASHADARRAIYERGRADERTAFLRALGVEP